MLITYTMYKVGHEPVPSVYPVDLQAWLDDGWTTEPVTVDESIPEEKPASKTKKAVTPDP